MSAFVPSSTLSLPSLRTSSFVVKAAPAVRPAVAEREVRKTVVTASHKLNGVPIAHPLAPIRNNILVKFAQAPEKTLGGILLAASAVEKPNYGTVIAAGPGSFYPNGKHVPMVVSQGQLVMFGKYGGNDVDYDGEKCTVITQDDVLCVLEGEKYEAHAVRPIYDRVLVKKSKATEKTSGGLIIAASASDKPNTGSVVAVGPGRLMEDGNYEPVPVKVGDSVMYKTYGGTEVQFDGEDYVLMRVVDIYAKF